MVSVVSPVYNSQGSLKELHSRLVSTLESIGNNFEVIFVDDGSTDESWESIRRICKTDSRVRGIHLSRNFGQHSAISAGLEAALGEWIVVIDCDLQDRPEEIVKLYNEAQNGFDIVLGQRLNRNDSFLKKLGSRMFYRLLSFLTKCPQDSSVANFGIYHKRVIESVLSMKDKVKYLPLMVQWVGYRAKSIEVLHDDRLTGETSYSFRKLVSLSLDIILSFSDRPLRLTVQFGFVLSAFTFLAAIVVFCCAYFGSITVPGWASLVISIWFLGGILITLIGVVGIYVGKTFDQVKGRPTYIVSERL